MALHKCLQGQPIAELLYFFPLCRSSLRVFVLGDLLKYVQTTRRIQRARRVRIVRDKVLQGLLVRGFLNFLPFTLILGGRWFRWRRLRWRLLFCELIPQVLKPLFGDMSIRILLGIAGEKFPKLLCGRSFRPGRSRPSHHHHHLLLPADVLGLAGLAAAPAKSNPRRANHRHTASVDCW